MKRAYVLRLPGTSVRLCLGKGVNIVWMCHTEYDQAR